MFTTLHDVKHIEYNHIYKNNKHMIITGVLISHLGTDNCWNLSQNTYFEECN